MADPSIPNKPRPLHGVRVLDFSSLIAGPSCGKYLADHGAEVIKMERYPNGDISRHSFAAVGLGRGPMYLQHNAGKKSMCVDLKQPEGIEIVLGLVAQVDVVIEAFTPGVMDRLGLDYDALCQHNPRLIMCSISGFGQTGPNAQRPGYAHISHAMTGWLGLQFLHRDPPETPRGPGIAIGDTTAGLTAFGAICAALFKREQTGEGEHIDIALFDALFGSNDVALQTALMTDDFEVWYHPVHTTRDGYITANVGPDFRAWENVCRAMGQTELLLDDRFNSQEKLQDHMAEASELVSAWLATLSCEEAERVLTEHHIACGIVLTVDQAVRQPQVAARGLVVDLEDPVFGPMQVINSAFKYKHADAGVLDPAPRLGEHNETVLASLLGYRAEQLQALKDKGVLKAGDA
ncbi:MAG: CaiB/BaiF CoA-transferase family protein [Candidatus Tectomicrobia bacterium]